MSGRILVVDDVATNRLVIKAKLERDYYDVIMAEDGVEALEKALEEEPDIILSDVMMPRMDGFELCRRLKDRPETAHIPVVMVTALNSPDERVRGIEAGADDFLLKPIDDLALCSRVRNLMRMKVMFDELRLRDETSRALGLDNFLEADGASTVVGQRVLLVHHDAAQAEDVALHLRQNLHVLVEVMTLEGKAFSSAMALPPDAVIVHHELADSGDGLRLLSWLRARAQTRHCAVLVITPEDDMRPAAKALDLGASDYLQDPVDLSELTARLRCQLQRKLYSDRLRSNVRDGLKMAVIDQLTGLFNRRYALQHMKNLADQARSAESPLSVMLLDLDRFKSVNDTYGHAAGDAVLREFARRLKENVRGADLTARIGGEEFCVALPETGFDLATTAAERIRQAVEAEPFKLDDGQFIEVTVSIGVSVATAGDLSPEHLLHEADTALYVSKNQGRNRVSFFDAAA